MTTACAACGLTARGGLDLDIVTIPYPAEPRYMADRESYDLAICPECAAKIARGDRLPAKVEVEDHP